MRMDIKNKLNSIPKEELNLLNKSEMARRLNCNPRTVSRYMEIQQGTHMPKEPVVRKSLLDDYKDIILDKVDNHGATTAAVYKFIQKKGYGGKYSILTDFVHKHKQEQFKKATVRFETNPGLQAQIDWKEDLTIVSYLGFILRRNSTVIDPKRLRRFKDKVREITKRNQPTPMEYVIKKLNPVLRGWLNYYRIADIKTLLLELMKWIRRRLRMIRMKQWKTYKKMHKKLRRKGIKHSGEKMNVTLWKNSNVHIIHQLMPNAYFKEIGLMDMCSHEVGLLSGDKVAW